MKISKLLLSLLSGAAFLILSNCITIDPIAPPLPSTYLFSSTKANLNCNAGGENGCASEKDGKAVGVKTGEACTSAILALVQTGDMSLKAAAADGKINEVQSVDYKSTTILGSVYMQKCLVVNGK